MTYSYDRTAAGTDLEQRYRSALHELDEVATELANALDAIPEHGGDAERAEQVAKVALFARTALKALPRRISPWRRGLPR